MRKVILYMQLTVDGFTEGPEGEMDWLKVDEETWRFINDLLDPADTALLGRVTYEVFESSWPEVAKDPSSPKEEVEYARWIEETPKVVFSRSLDRVGWKNTRLAKGDLAEEIAELKGQPGGNMILFGGIGIARAFMRLGLIDEYRLLVNPSLIGAGKPLFGDPEARADLRLIEAQTFASGVVGLYYETDRSA
ncbi:dihydrofolate reductase family protein [Streptosporangium carneum]|uniref:Bacterial bifunctional deaminase-reductase C-terminal domain-containing protein n=1 Tax=Streptosporangium carneum TaxID=47481 RepID=A0A9W6HZ32_9ACTN|nr:dihydrofolate reductase family protein [Streptosporangium carneum]GLK08294.1 hypothetical protein GCM10017600_16990 [Streptosporangium carneum]